MPQNEHIEEFQRRHGKRFDHEEVTRKRKARAVHEDATHAKRIHGLRAILHNQKRYKEKAAMKKTIKAHQVRRASTTAFDNNIIDL
jgi:ribosome biogenesis protein NSA2